MLRLFLGPPGAPALLYKAKQVRKESQTSLSKSKTFHSCLKIKLLSFWYVLCFPWNMRPWNLMGNQIMFYKEQHSINKCMNKYVLIPT